MLVSMSPDTPPADVPVTELCTSLYRSRVDRPMLDQVIRDAGHGWLAVVSLETVHRGARLRAPTAAALVDQVRGIDSDNMVEVDNLRITASAPDRWVAITIGPRSSSVTVVAPDPVWARGKLDQVRASLHRAGGTRRPVRWGEWQCAGAAAVVGLLTLVTAVSAGAVGPGLPSLVIASLLVLVLITAAYAVGRGRRRRACTRVRLAGPWAAGSLWSRLTTIEKGAWAGIGSVVAAVIARLVGL